MFDYCAKLQDYQKRFEDVAKTLRLLKKLAKQATNPFSDIIPAIDKLEIEKKDLAKKYKVLYSEFCEEAECIAMADYD